MSMALMIGLGITVWLLVATAVALVMAKIIRQRDGQSLGYTARSMVGRRSVVGRGGVAGRACGG